MGRWFTFDVMSVHVYGTSINVDVSEGRWSQCNNDTRLACAGLNNHFLFVAKMATSSSLPSLLSRISLFVAIFSVLLAFWYKHDGEISRRSLEQSSSTSNHPRKNDSLIVYAIGDLHGDVECAKQWVRRTGVVDETTNQWKNDQTRLVFLGDYIDKGITSKQTVEYVKSLTEQFPSYVTAIVGNHELELLRDRTETIWADGHAGYYQVRWLVLPVHVGLTHGTL